ncbi:hypothetical protein chiPu_0014458 [Chiloscyllium punctatum]|uniref:Uncharacterized protein n=1 Tax=Chiloscyllium punctatum TaxID=137246 RepID=A0A401T013_CHIPU|nr:hypothetical protein [Chiloscyllium punctatum]
MKTQRMRITGDGSTHAHFRPGRKARLRRIFSDGSGHSQSRPRRGDRSGGLPVTILHMRNFDMRVETAERIAGDGAYAQFRRGRGDGSGVMPATVWHMRAFR